MPFVTDADLYNGWAALGGTYKKFDQGKYLQRAGNTVVSLGNDKYGRTRSKDVAGGICRALALRFIECRLTGMADMEELKETLKASFDVSMVQQGAFTFGMKDQTRAGGKEGSKTGGYNTVTRAVSGREDLCDKIMSDEQLYIYSFGGDSGGHSVAFDTTKPFYFSIRTLAYSCAATFQAPGFWRGSRTFGLTRV